MIERGNFEPLSPKGLKDFDFNVLKLILTLKSITAGLISQFAGAGRCRTSRPARANASDALLSRRESI
jgi:hypothetical protein